MGRRSSFRKRRIRPQSSVNCVQLPISTTNPGIQLMTGWLSAYAEEHVPQNIGLSEMGNIPHLLVEPTTLYTIHTIYKHTLQRDIPLE